MRKALVATIAAGALLVPATSPAVELDEPESCFAVNPGQPKCSFTATSESSSGTITGAVGPGSWVVTVVRGKKKITFKNSADGQPTSFAFKPGDKVTANVKSPGWVLVGHD